MNMNPIIEMLLKLERANQAQVCPEEIDAIRNGIPPDVLSQFERFQQRGKRGIAMLRKSNCSGCHLRQPVSLIHSIHNQEALVQCVHCGRFLYMLDQESAPTSAQRSDAGIGL